MGLIDELAILLVGAEARINAIVVGGGVAVVGGVFPLGVGRVVLQHGREPQGGDAELGEVVEVLSDAFEVAAVAQRRLGAVFAIGVHPLDLRGMVFTLCEAVGHQQIEYIGVGESLALVACHVALFQFVGDGGVLVALCEGQRQRAGLAAFHVQIDQQVVRRVEAHDGVDFRAVGLNFGLADALAIDHQLQRRVFQARVPVGGVDAGDFYVVFSELRECFRVFHTIVAGRHQCKSNSDNEEKFNFVHCFLIFSGVRGYGGARIVFPIEMINYFAMSEMAKPPPGACFNLSVWPAFTVFFVMV